MLTNLIIKNIALIDSLEISFNKGLNILSGETGAGKSIIIDSINFVLGKRTDKGIIRYGEDKAIVTALFDTYNSAETVKLLNEMDIEVEDEILLKRSMSLDGKSVCSINGEKVTLTMLKQVSSTLIDIYGQNETSNILEPQSHLSILDGFGQKTINLYKEKQLSLYNSYKDCCNKLKKYGSVKEVAKNLDLYEYQINEISEANLIEDEEDELIALRHKMNNSQSIITGLNTAHEVIDGDNEMTLLNALYIIKNSLTPIAQYDDEIDAILDRIETVKDEMKDVSSTLEVLAENCDFDPAEYNRIDERISLIRTLKKKYGNTIKEILDYYNDIKEKYDFLNEGEQKVQELEEEKQKLKKALYDNAIMLSNERKKVSSDLSSRIIKELEQLGMKGARFDTKFEDIESIENLNEIGPNGLDSMQFIFSANIGQPLKELNKIISGGELSRFMLALKNIIANLDGINTMIFDEIDSGISGQIAQVVAEKLYNISCDRQVLAITHLPQLAAMADNHYLIKKYSTDTNTVTKVELLKGDELINEIARLIGGNENSNFAIPHAKEMKEHANSLKK